MDKPCYVYAIKSLRDGRIYVGLSYDIPTRINSHNKGEVFSTKGYKPWSLIYNETLVNRTEARKREKYLKSGIGKEFLKKLLIN